MGTIIADTNETIRCEYVSAILDASIDIVRRLPGMKKQITLRVPVFSTGQAPE